MCVPGVFWQEFYHSAGPLEADSAAGSDAPAAPATPTTAAPLRPAPARDDDESDTTEDDPGMRLMQPWYEFCATLVLRYRILEESMGGATGGGGDAGDFSPRFEIPGGMSPQKSGFLKKIFGIFAIFWIFQYFQNKVGEIRGEIRIWG